MREPSIRAVALTKRYGAVQAVNGISFDVAAGEIFGFLGRNGSGKTTTVRMLTTLTAPTAGDAFVGGHHVERDAAAVRARVGVTMQDAALDPKMTGAEHLRFVARLWGFSKARAAERGARLLEVFGLTADAQRPIGTYSGGMQRRLDIATSLLSEPKILFLDEPTTGLDPQSRRALWEEIRRLRGDGATVFLTTQYLEEADQLADRVAIVDAGAIIAEGTPAQLKRAHGKRYVSVEASGSIEGLRRRLDGFAIDAREGRVSVELDGDGGVERVLDAIRAEVGALDGLSVSDVDLEDVFVRLTGTAIAVGAQANPAQGNGAHA